MLHLQLCGKYHFATELSNITLQQDNILLLSFIDYALQCYIGTCQQLG
jgi:hypothetical protein